MATQPLAPLDALVDACAPLPFAPLPQLTDEPPARHETQDGRAITWYRADDFLAAGGVPDSYAAMVRREGVSYRPALAMRYMRALFRELTFLLAAGLYLRDCAAELSGDRLWLSVDEDGCLRTPRLAPARAAVLAGGPDDRGVDVERPEVTVLADRAELHGWASERLIACAGPLIDELHRHTRVGRRVLWGYVFDCLHFYMLNPARWLGADMTSAWRRAEEFAEVLGASGAPTRKKPRMVTFGEADRPGVWAVRGTCCFDYRADPEHGYCVTCPLERDEVREPRLVTAFPSSEYGMARSDG
ncbi:(2Fe-2S)-binding protein [Tamaricihabitans halophyticus]|uniref:(2Fe-2S)-binding protein n=1 Tax=Tamaricihabitans halophyticus TaxID=1262583 RepID=UPI00140458D3|nr:(2Fe-2S)-binding protein [Tamaricihabitans halophyticus]